MCIYIYIYVYYIIILHDSRILTFLSDYTKYIHSILCYSTPSEAYGMEKQQNKYVIAPSPRPTRGL